MTRSPGGIALPAALGALAVSLVLAAGVAEVTRTEVALVRSRRATAAALAAVDGCLARGLSTLPPGWDFAAPLAGSDGLAGTPDDGALALPAGCAGHAQAAPGPPDPPRLRVTVEGRRGEGRRIVEALVGRKGSPGVGALAWLGEIPPPGAITGTLVLAGADRSDPLAPRWAGLATPADPAVLDAWLAAESARIDADTEPPLWSPPPPVIALASRLQATGPAGAEVLVTSGTPALARAFVPTDLVVPGALSGAGLLFVAGTLDIRDTLHFTGVVVAAGGVRIAGGARLTVDGVLWVGAPAVPGSSMRVDGLLELRRDGAALAAADALLPLPRQAVLLGLRDLG